MAEGSLNYTLEAKTEYEKKKDNRRIEEKRNRPSIDTGDEREGLKQKEERDRSRSPKRGEKGLTDRKISARGDTRTIRSG